MTFNMIPDTFDFISTQSFFLLNYFSCVSPTLISFNIIKWFLFILPNFSYITTYFFYLMKYIVHFLLYSYWKQFYFTPEFNSVPPCTLILTYPEDTFIMVSNDYLLFSFIQLIFHFIFFITNIQMRQSHFSKLPFKV